jgi:hypothetical protein
MQKYEMEEKFVMKRLIPRFKSTRLVYALFLACIMLLSYGLAASAAEEGSPDLVQTETLPTATATPLPAFQEEAPKELYPTDVQAVIEGGTRQIIKTYTLTAGQNPAGIPRDSFIRDGWRYELTDITEKRTSETDTRIHTETVEINTETKDLNEIIKLLAPTLDYQGEDGYCGLLALDLASISCEAAGYINSSYTATAIREYPHLSNADTSLIPKAITDSGRSLTLDSVSWETQRYTNVDYEDIPESYRAVATYSAKASRSVVTGYITTADYTGEVNRTVMGDTVYTVYFSGSEIDPAPKPVEPPPTIERGGAFPVTLFLIILAAILALLAGAGAYWFLLRHNVKVYKVIDGKRTLVAKDKISTKKALIDLSPLDGYYFIIEIDKYAAKALNSHKVEIRHDDTSQKHKIAYEGNAYTIEADFLAGTIQAIY